VVLVGVRDAWKSRPEHFTGRAGSKKPGFLGRENHAHDRPVSFVDRPDTDRQRCRCGK
jgi:hypothetical protein